MALVPKEVPEWLLAGIEALRSRGSVDELFAPWQGGEITRYEVLARLWAFLHDQPGLLAEVVALLRQQPAETSRRFGTILERLARELVERRTASRSSPESTP
jgi:hypothetical protein